MLQDTIRALNDPVRRQILEILKPGPKNVGEILKELDITGATLSHHLKVLKDTGLLSYTKKGNRIIYEINTSVFEDVISWISKLIDKEQKNEK